MKDTHTQPAINDAVLGRMRHLLALKSSDNEHEAALAASRLQEMLLKFNLDMGVLETPAAQQKAGRVVTNSTKRRPAHEHVIARAVEELYDVRYFLTLTRHGVNDISNRIVFVGLLANVETALMAFNFMVESIDALAQGRGRTGHLRGLKQFRDYKLGAAQRIRDDAKKRKDASLIEGGTQCTALVRLGNEVANREFALATTPTPGAQQFKGWSLKGASDFNAHNLGYSDGSKVDPAGASKSRMIGER